MRFGCFVRNARNARIASLRSWSLVLKLAWADIEMIRREFRSEMQMVAPEKAFDPLIFMRSVQDAFHQIFRSLDIFHHV